MMIPRRGWKLVAFALLTGCMVSATGCLTWEEWSSVPQDLPPELQRDTIARDPGRGD